MLKDIKGKSIASQAAGSTADIVLKGADMVGVLSGIFAIECFFTLLDGYVLEWWKRRLLKWKYV